MPLFQWPGLLTSNYDILPMPESSYTALLPNSAGLPVPLSSITAAGSSSGFLSSGLSSLIIAAPSASAGINGFSRSSSPLRFCSLDTTCPFSPARSHPRLRSHHQVARPPSAPTPATAPATMPAMTPLLKPLLSPG